MREQYKYNYVLNNVAEDDYKTKCEILENMWDKQYFTDKQIETINRENQEIMDNCKSRGYKCAK